MKCKKCGTPLEINENSDTTILCLKCKEKNTIDKKQLDELKQQKKTIESLKAQLESREVKVVKKKKLSFKSIILIAIILFVFLGLVRDKEEVEEVFDENPWASECTSIGEFEYELQKQSLYIRKYIGKEKKIRICKNYIINDKEYRLQTFEDDVFKSADIYSVMLPNNITTIPPKTFQNSNMKYLYLSNKVEKMPEVEHQFTHYLENVDIIYFEGTEYDWQVLTDYEDPKKIDAKKIIYETKIEDLKITNN